MTRIPPILEQAKRGDAKAIASLLNRHLKPKGITAKVNRKGDCLRVMLESLQVPSQLKAVQFVHQGLRKLQAEPIKMVTVYGRKVGQEFPAWYQDLDLSSEVIDPISNATQPADFANSIGVVPGVYHTTSVSDPTKQAKLPKRLGRVLVAFLGLWIGFNSLFLIYSLVWSTSYYIYSVLDVADATGFLAYLIYYLVAAIDSLWYPLESLTTVISFITIALFLVWLHRLHARIRMVFSGYPITPWGAVARFTIPFYSLWGIGNTITTLANRFKSRGGEFVRWGNSLHRWLPWFYSSLIASDVLSKFYWFQVDSGYEDEFSPLFFMAKTVADLMLSGVWLQIVRLMSKGMSQAVNGSLSRDYTNNHSVRQQSPSYPQGFQIKAVLYGLLVDVIGIHLIKFIISFLPISLIVITGISAEQLTLTVGLLLTLGAGFITAYLAKTLELKHAFVMGSASAFISLIIRGFQVPSRFHAIALLLTIPAALLGGYVYKSQFKVQHSK